LSTVIAGANDYEQVGLLVKGHRYRELVEWIDPTQPRENIMKRTLGLVVAAGLVLVGCGSSSKSPTGASATTIAAKTATTTPGGATTSAGGGTTAGSSGAAGGIEVTEKEFSIVLASPLKAGANTLSVKNTGSFPHELKVIKADSYASLAQAADGTVDEAKLGAAVVGKSGRVANGASGSLAVTLEAGKYVLICNLGTGANNHASKGMHVDVTVG
jgi:uncharacterized cupredoxin-like copper-binding protein